MTGAKKYELLKKIAWTCFFLIVLLIGQKIMVPGINPAVAKVALEKQTFLQMLGSTIGGQFALPTLFSLGLGPYMTGMIIWQAVTALNLEKINQLSAIQVGYIQKIIALGLAILQSLVMVRYLKPALVALDLFHFQFSQNVTSWVVILMLVSGALFTIYLGDQNADKGLGGSTMLILPGIVLGLPNQLMSGWGKMDYPLTNHHLLIAGFTTLIMIFIFNFLFKVEIHIPIERPLMEGTLRQSYLPFKLMIAGAMPFMFSSTLFTLPKSVIEDNQTFSVTAWGKMILSITNYQTIKGIICYGIIILILTYAFGFITVQPLKLAKQMKENNDYIMNVFPGTKTENHLLKYFFVMATIGGLCLAVIGMTPLLLGMYWKGTANYTVYLGSLAILVTLEQVLFDQIQALYSKTHYRIF